MASTGKSFRIVHVCARSHCLVELNQNFCRSGGFPFSFFFPITEISSRFGTSDAFSDLYSTQSTCRMARRVRYFIRDAAMEIAEGLDSSIMNCKARRHQLSQITIRRSRGVLRLKRFPSLGVTKHYKLQ